MNPLYSIAEIRAVEQAALAELPPGTLMQRAGKAAADCAHGILGNEPEQAQVLVLAGPGNNGGDALEVAAHMAHADAAVSVLLYAQPERQSDEAKTALRRAQQSPARLLETGASADAAKLVREQDWALIIDGLFGIGLTKPITGELLALIEAVNAKNCPVLALDNPSGLDADTGAIIGADNANSNSAIRATHTITFIGDKPGLHTLHGRDHAGQVTVAPLGIDQRHYPAPRIWLNDISLFATALKPRRHASHKGSYGNVAVIGGASGMAGAPILAARAALYCGAGRVYAVFLDQAPAFDSAQPELMLRDARQFDADSAVLVAGPGLGQSRDAHDLLAQALNAANPIVLDADALNLIAAEPGLQQKTARRKNATLMTPHPLEAARLLDQTTADIQTNRLLAAQQLAQRFNATVILKGSGSVIAHPDAQTVINPTGNPALATAGTGDVLAGICGALLAQGWPAREAALGATWLHGKAADDLVQQGIGPIGIAACELLPALRAALNRLCSRNGMTVTPK
ncbi:MAG: carbohydrate kinase family protein [Burkholderiaceae bacterium]|nr:carbohydrate kinase family protein [Burkholderiaceae bacterium]